LSVRRRGWGPRTGHARAKGLGAQVWAIIVDEYTHTDRYEVGLPALTSNPLWGRTQSVAFPFLENNGKRLSFLCMENNNLLSVRSEILSLLGLQSINHKKPKNIHLYVG